MLEPPDLRSEAVADRLSETYRLQAEEIAFLPVGADGQTAVYRVAAQGGKAYFLKLRWGPFDPTPVALLGHMAGRGIRQVIAPLPAAGGLLWSDWGECTATLYPFVEGRDGFAAALAPGQWAELGAVLRQVHGLVLPSALAERIRREDYSPRWREALQRCMGRLDEAADEPAARGMAALLEERRAEIEHLLARADALAHELRAQRQPLVLCHSDVHAGNVLIDAAGALYLVDWDEPIYAPKERDLMFPGGAQGFVGYAPEAEEELFFQGYGPAMVDRPTLAYYRYERIVADLAIFAEQLLFCTEGGGDRPQWLDWAASNFWPGHTLERARAADPALAWPWAGSYPAA